MLSVKDHLLTLLRVNNTAHLPTKPDQVAKGGRLERKLSLTYISQILYRIYQNGLNQVPQSLGTPSISKSTNRDSSIPFVGNLHFSILLHRLQRAGHHSPR